MRVDLVPDGGRDMAHGDLTHIDIPVGDTARATAFHESLFGWQVAEVPGFEGYPRGRAPDQTSGGGLAPRTDSFTRPRSHVEVDPIDRTLAQAVELGGRVVLSMAPIDATRLVGGLRGPGRERRRPARGARGRRAE